MSKTILKSLLFFLPVAAFAATAQQYYDAGLQLYNQKQYNQAVAYFKAAVQMDPSNWQADQALGSAYYAEGDKTDALSAYDQSLALHPNPQLQQFADGLRGSTPPPAYPSAAHSSVSNPGPVVGGGNFGIGLEFGEPGTYGASGKYWLDQQSAFQAEVKLNGGALFQFAYLWHDFDLIQAKNGAFAFYIGIGGDVAVNGVLAAAVEAPVGVTYLFQKSQIPIDLYVQAEPSFWVTPATLFQIYGSLGARYYF
ncbi:MAG TPA: tetratricopeptide repeat protein [bacterium]|nr:tetratricopeptide repeat protein [bacterium]